MEVKTRDRKTSRIRLCKCYAKVELTRGLFAKVDLEDIPLVCEFKWYAKPSANTTYAVYTPRGQRNAVGMHRIIASAGAWDGKVSIDHINGDGLDNRRANLRIASHTVQKLNERVRKDNTSGSSGVHLRPNGTWQARLAVRNRRFSLGHFDSYAQAARCRKEVMKIVEFLLEEIGTLKKDEVA